MIGSNTDIFLLWTIGGILVFVVVGLAIALGVSKFLGWLDGVSVESDDEQSLD